MSQVNTLLVNADLLKRATSIDQVLSKVLHFVQRGWPLRVNPDLKPFLQCKNELIVEVGCLMWGIGVVIPARFKSAVLDELHTSHTGTRSLNKVIGQTVCVVARY